MVNALIGLTPNMVRGIFNRRANLWRTINYRYEQTEKNLSSCYSELFADEVVTTEDYDVSHADLFVPSNAYMLKKINNVRTKLKLDPIPNDVDLSRYILRVTHDYGVYPTRRITRAQVALGDDVLRCAIDDVLTYAADFCRPYGIDIDTEDCEYDLMYQIQLHELARAALEMENKTLPINALRCLAISHREICRIKDLIEDLLNGK